MYTHHFEMKQTPFLERPQIDRLLHDDHFERHLARLRHFRENGRLALLTGRTGIGKTSLVRAFLSECEPRHFLPVHVELSRLNATALLRQVISDLGEKPALGRDRLFTQLIKKATIASKTVLLVIDDSQLPEPDALIDLRLLADTSRPDESPLFRILLSGQDDLLRLIRQERFADLRGRICIRVAMHPLNEDETVLYIERQLKNAGVNSKIFEPEVERMIYEYSGGVPRAINNAATACLIAAVADGLKNINENCCNRALEELI